MSCADLASNSHLSVLNVKSVPHDCSFLAPKLTKTPVVPALWSVVQCGSFWASSERQVWFIEAGQSSLQTYCGSAGCVSVPRAFCFLGWIPSHTFPQVAQMLSDAREREVSLDSVRNVALFAAAPLRALQWLMTTGVVLLHSPENQMLLLLPPTSFPGGRQTKKRDHSTSAPDDDS